MVIPFTTCFSPTDVGFVVGGRVVVTRREVGSSVESDRRCSAGPLSNYIIFSVDKAGVDPAEVEGTVGAERRDGFRHVHGHVNGWNGRVVAGHIELVVS